MKKMTFLLLLIFLIPTHAFMFNLSVWKREQPCTQSFCLPERQELLGPFELVEPKMNSFTQLRIPYGSLTIKLTFSKKDSFGGYYSFQTEIVDRNKDIIALCSRYETLKTFENVPVGACGGTISENKNLIGVSLLKVQ